eukprot:scaffold21356_cov83-Phaeocystis_antarctica.AAC.1
MKNWRDGERAATAAAMVAPAETPQMPLIGECCSIQRSTCRTLSLTAAARPASSSADRRLPKSCGIGLTTCGASVNSSLTPCLWSSVSQPLSSSILRISELSPASPCSTRSTISAERRAAARSGAQRPTCSAAPARPRLAPAAAGCAAPPRPASRAPPPSAARPHRPRRPPCAPPAQAPSRATPPLQLSAPPPPSFVP